jgi:hypothetical protein
LTDFDITAREISGYRTRFEATEKRLDEVEKVNARLEDAALTTARALQEISDLGTRSMRRCAAKTNPNWPLRSDHQVQA